MKSLLSCLALLAVACHSKTVSEQPADSSALMFSEVAEASAAPYEGTSQAASSFRVSTLDFDALVVPQTTVYKDSTEEAEGVAELSRLVPVSIVAKSVLKHPLGGELCSVFPWYQVRFSDGDIGWVYGEKLILAPEDGRPTASFRLAGNDYQLYLGFDAGVGASNEDGLTGCNSYQVVYVTQPRDTVVHMLPHEPLANGMQSAGVAFFGWFSFINSEGVGSQITQVSTQTLGNGTEVVRVKFVLSYQEGGAEGYIDLAMSGDDLVIYQTVFEGADAGD
ncbi:MAG: hypothetical protein MUC38_11450 [Cyclobacteriaceae bacterium]|jgi:hypothetical protein|nr:hypothetical protein [Cyclobacteriaceae bacterium]